MAETFFFLIPTPIGNLEDMTYRAVRVLQEVQTILAEDTRTSKKLLQHYNINTSLESFHAHNEHRQLPKIIERLRSGEKIALISDAGTPGISDPGFLLARECVKENISFECLPGATAFVPALVKSGLPTDAFVYEGFLPHKKGRQTKLKELATEKRTIVLYESPHRLMKLLNEISEFMGDRNVSISRELTKLHEETINGPVDLVRDHFEQKGVKGEIVVVISGENAKI
jgi:16S rRNA (cytidine1402-2'-O)-methyltransferase